MRAVLPFKKRFSAGVTGKSGEKQSRKKSHLSPDKEKSKAEKEGEKKKATLAKIKGQGEKNERHDGGKINDPNVGRTARSASER